PSPTCRITAARARSAARAASSVRIDAVLDVTDPEIPEAGSDFYDLPNVFLTPHIAGAIGLERERLGEMAVDEIER
ncbi:NAD(P)-dependent oxidoreductase, partial [Rhizobium ruizarguesonis]